MRKTFPEVIHGKKFKYQFKKKNTQLCLVEHNFELFSDSSSHAPLDSTLAGQCYSDIICQ